MCKSVFNFAKRLSIDKFPLQVGYSISSVSISQNIDRVLIEIVIGKQYFRPWKQGIPENVWIKKNTFVFVVEHLPVPDWR